MRPGVMEITTANNALELPANYRGPRLAAARSSWPAVQPSRYMSSLGTAVQWVGACVLSVGGAVALAAPISELEARASNSLATPEGRAYEQKASDAFFERGTFMGECAPANPKSPDPITVYVEILSDGTMGQLEVTPMTTVAKCILARRTEVKFPRPPSPYVLKLDLRFTR